MIFAEKLKTLRKEKNISQEQLAEKINFPSISHEQKILDYGVAYGRDRF